MASDWAVIRRAAIPFLAGVAASAAVFERLYATALLAFAVALWAAALVQQAAQRRAAPPTTPPLPAPAVDAAERQRLKLYLDLSPAPLIALDRAGRLHAINRAARRLFACEDLIADPPSGLIEAIGGTVPGRSTTVRIGEGESAPLYALTTADLHGDGQTMRVATLIDIDADMKAAEAAALRDLVQVLGHEVTNTLTPIASLSASAAAMIAEPDADPDAIREAIETVARRALGLQRFGEAYRDLARLPPPTRAPTDLVALVRDLARLFETHWPDATLVIDIGQPSIRHAVDADQLSQAVWALLQNAAEIADTITLAIEMTATGVSISIKDNGPGIADRDADLIFRPFYTTKATGSGIGLALARQVCRGHGGDLIIADRRAMHTRFEITLP
jgi:two-component system, NtrC family, nitrogen regulation sensor histidine kinase NtrY